MTSSTPNLAQWLEEGLVDDETERVEVRPDSGGLYDDPTVVTVFEPLDPFEWTLDVPEDEPERVPVAAYVAVAVIWVSLAAAVAVAGLGLFALLMA